MFENKKCETEDIELTWNASKLLSGVGFTAKTIPFTQWLFPVVSDQSLQRRKNLPLLSTEEPNGSRRVCHGEVKGLVRGVGSRKETRVNT